MSNRTQPIATAPQLGALLQGTRKSRKLTQAQLGARMGLSQKRVSELEQEVLFHTGKADETRRILEAREAEQRLYMLDCSMMPETEEEGRRRIRMQIENLRKAEAAFNRLEKVS